MEIFSLILPTYNRAWVLEKTIQSVLSQAFTDLELLIIDDGSTDHTENLIKSFQKNDPRIKYFKQANSGAATARQTGLTLAKGQWIAYVDSDDQLYPFFLSGAWHFFQSHPNVYFSTTNMDRALVLHNEKHEQLDIVIEPPTQKKPEKIILQDYYHWNIKPCGTGIFHLRELSEIINAQICWDKSFNFLEDLDFLLQLGKYYPQNFGYIPEKLFHYQQIFGTDGVCARAKYKDWADTFEKLYLKHQNNPLMQGQTWYPEKVRKYQEKQKLYEAGKLGLPYERYFPRFFDSTLVDFYSKLK